MTQREKGEGRLFRLKEMNKFTVEKRARRFQKVEKERMKHRDVTGRYG